MVIYFSICVLVLLASIGGIIYLQRAGRAGKYAWKKQDTQLLKGCGLQIVPGYPFLIFAGYLIEKFAPILSAYFRPDLAGLLLYIALQYLCGGFNAIFKKISEMTDHDK